MGDAEGAGGRASTRVTELKKKIEKATELIGELRESNYSLSGEIAELRRELDSRPEGGAPTESSANDDGASQAELEALRQERKAIREKIALLLERIEKLES